MTRARWPGSSSRCSPLDNTDSVNQQRKTPLQSRIHRPTGGHVMTTQVIDRALLADLRARNIKTVTISYSGGNDSGGCDGVNAVDYEGKPVELSDAYVCEASGDWECDEKGVAFPAGTKLIHIWNRGGKSFYRVAEDKD